MDTNDLRREAEWYRRDRPTSGKEAIILLESAADTIDRLRARLATARQEAAMELAAVQQERDALKDLIYGEHGLDERLKAADLNWNHWQIKARELETERHALKGEVERLAGVKG